MLYELVRPLLFQLNPETAHRVAFTALNTAYHLGLTPLLSGQVPQSPRRVMGLEFPNPVGLAAGLDKNGDYIDALANLGFGFIEVGTVTPQPQPGNPAPRLFRLPQAKALINRMGFNNKGIDYLLKRVRRAQFRGVLGINIGKNFDTPLERAVDDYLIGLRKAYPHAGYIVVNISSPNTPGLRTLQYGEALEQLLGALRAEQLRLKQEHGKYVPVAVKVAPDLDPEEIRTIADAVRTCEIDAVIATNTTVSRAGVEGLPHAAEAGGLSGAPLLARSTEVLRQLRQYVGKDMPLIAAGGIMSGADARMKIEAGADLVQIYTGFIYRGPALIREIATALQ